VNTYQIAGVAQRSGFSAATLRYYEAVGLLAPAGRTEAGYRLYDDASLDRLRFIARAKQLGCTLDEIRDLTTAWDGGECGPVQDRLRTVVETKATEARDRIAELTTFTADLQRALATLSAHRPDGPCDDACGCTSDASTATPDDAAMPVPLTDKRRAPIEASPDAPPIACTLEPGEMPSRLGEWTALLDPERGSVRGVTDRQPLSNGIRLEFGPQAAVAAIVRLAAAEQGCCRFLRFALVIDDRGTALEVQAPPEAAEVVTALFGAA
jgi:MerR family transcriptional regulator, copper efflux regulator